MKGVGITLGAVLSFVLSNIIFKKVEDHASPQLINATRTAIGFITFIIIGIFLDLFRLIPLLASKTIFLLLISILFGQVLGDTSYFIAQKHLGTSQALAVSMTFPFFTMLFSFIHKPIFHWNFLLGGILIAIGVYLIGKHHEQRLDESLKNKDSMNTRNAPEIQKKPMIPILWGLFAAISWAIGAILTEISMNYVANDAGTDYSTAFLGNILRFPLAVALLSWIVKSRREDSLKSISRRSWCLLLLGSLIGTSLGAYLYAESARVAGASLLSIMVSASPLFAFPLSYWINKETLSKIGLAGVLLSTGGLLLILLY